MKRFKVGDSVYFYLDGLLYRTSQKGWRNIGAFKNVFGAIAAAIEIEKGSAYKVFEEMSGA